MDVMDVASGARLPWGGMACAPRPGRDATGRGQLPAMGQTRFSRMTRDVARLMPLTWSQTIGKSRHGARTA